MHLKTIDDGIHRRVVANEMIHERFDNSWPEYKVRIILWARESLGTYEKTSRPYTENAYLETYPF